MEKANFRILGLILLLAGSSAFSQGTFNFAGQVKYHDNYAMSGVNAYLHAPDGNIIAIDTTDYQGNYEFENLLPGNYTVTFETDEQAGGVELADAYAVLMYLNGQLTLSPIQQLAADVNGNGVINMGDYNAIMHEYLNQGKPFPIGPWVFESLEIIVPNTSRDGLSKSGSSSGDVNGSLVPDPKSNNIFINSPAVDITADLSKTIEYNITCERSLQISGMHLIVEVPEGLEEVSTTSPFQNVIITKTGNQIIATWLDLSLQGYELSENAPLLVIKAKPKSLTSEVKSYSLKINDDSHFIDLEGEAISGVSLNVPTINLKGQKEITLTVYPNPFFDLATLDYQLLYDGQVVINLYDQAGRLVQEVENENLTAGNQQAKIDGKSLLPGIYHYNIINSGQELSVLTGTIIKSK